MRITGQPNASTPTRGRYLAVYANRSVRTKVMAASLAAIFVAVTVGVTAIVQFNQLGTRTQAINTGALVPLAKLGEVRRAVLQSRIDAVADDLLNNGTEHQLYLTDLATVDKAIADYAASNDDPAGVRTPLAMFTTAWAQYKELVSGELLTLARSREWAGYVALRDGKVNPAAAAYNDALSSLERKEAADAARQVAQAHTDATRSRNLIIAFLIIGSLVALGLTLAVTRAIVSAVRRVSEVIDGLAVGDLTRSADVSTNDELGQMATALNTATATLRQTLASVAGNASALAEASGEQSRVAAQISTSADETSTQSQVASATAEQISRNVRTIAAGAEEMSTSIEEIAHNASVAAQVAEHAVTVAERADTTITELGASSIEIGNVIKTITSIAAQTNLLALNATIEAARAGEAGQGFAIVANEVKDLAQKTTTATATITRQVTTIQGNADAAVTSIHEISTVIEKINSYQATIASAVEEQAATTREMTRNVAEAATGADEIAGNVMVVATVADDTRTGMTVSRQAAERVAAMSGELRDLASHFAY